MIKDNKVKKTIDNSQTGNCTGCGACATICPQNSIQILDDDEGFYKPFVDYDTCIGCSRCLTLCPAMKNQVPENSNNSRAFAFINSDKSVLLKSTSGGFFSTISDWIFENKGVVIGCIYNDDFVAVHTVAENKLEIEPMRGSKYVESRVWPVFNHIKDYLKQEKKVLFTGTACQIAGLYASMENKVYDDLYTIEILCHGVPSHTLFAQYIGYLENKKGKLLEYNFRDKQNWGWGSWGTYYYLNSKNMPQRYNLITENDFYYSLYFKENNYRESCYSCQYARFPRNADITIGDFWGIENLLPDSKIKAGVSLVLTNTSKGEALFLDVARNHFAFEVPIEDAVKYNSTILTPAPRPETRDTFYDDLLEYGFEECAKRYCKLHYVIPIVARYIPSCIKRIIKKMLKYVR